MGKVIGVINTKGGVGKTTLATSLASEFSRRGYKTLLIDYDSQSSATHLLGFYPEDFIGTEFDITNIFREEPVKEIYIKENLYLIASNSKLKEYAESGKSGKEYYLSDFVQGNYIEGSKGIKEEYDIVIIDSEGGGGTLETSVQIASDYIIIPIRPTILDETGTLLTLKKLIENIKIFKLKDLTLLGFIAIDFDKRAKEPLERYSALKVELPEIISSVKFLKTSVPPDELFLPELYRRAVWSKAFANNMLIHDYIEKYETYNKDVLLTLENIGNKILERMKR